MRHPLESERSTARRPQASRVLAALGAAALATVGLPVLLTAITPRPASADITTNSKDNQRTGWYPDQAGLTPGLVSGGTFGQLFKATVNGQVYAQPIVSNGRLLVATETNNVYSLDPANGAQQWTRDLGTPWNPADIGCPDLVPSIGVTSTPVVDASTGTMYLFSKTYASGASGPAAWWAHAIDITTGLDRPGYPIQVQGNAANQPLQAFNPTNQMQRPGLLLLNGVVYAGFGAHCDHGPYGGWIAGIPTWSPTKPPPTGPTYALTTLWAAAKTGGAGIWQGGSGLLSDGTHIFIATGNSGISAAVKAGPVPGTPAPDSLGMSVARLNVQPDGSLVAADFFSPYDALILDKSDQDFGSGGPVGLPAAYFGTPKIPNLLVVVGKQGYVYLLDQANLGGYQQGLTGGDNVVSRIGPYGGVWGKAGVWPGDGGYVYYVTSTGGTGALSGFLRAYKSGVDGVGNPTLSLVGASTDSFGFGSGSPVVTSNGVGSGTALVWTVWSPNGNGTNAQLRAYDPVPKADGTMNLRWSAPIGTATKFFTPAVDSNRVYVGTRDGTVIGFGAPISPPLLGPEVTFPVTAVGQTSQLNATFQATRDVTVTAASSNNTAFTLGTPTVSGSTATGYPILVLSSQTLTIPVTFAPQAAGPASATLALTTSGGNVSTGLTGTGQTAAAHLSVNPKLLSLGGVSVTGPPASGSITFTNDGGTTLTVTAITLPASAAVSVTGLPAVGSTIASGAGVTATVTFTPTTTGPLNDSLVLGTSAGSITVPITAQVGTAPQLLITPPAFDFGNIPVGVTGTATFTVSNPGGTPLTITKSKPPGLNIGFTATSSLAEGSSIPAGGATTQTVTFLAATPGSYADQWVITGNDGSGVQYVNFTANAVASTALPSPIGGGWTTNGTTTIAGNLLQLTPATASAAGSAFWPTPISSSYFSAAFDATIDSGTGADGLTFTMADPTRGATPTSLGTNGGGLGFSGIPGLAVALDTFQNAANPSANFVGLTAGGQTPGSDLLLWMFTNSAVPSLRPGSNHVVVTVANGTLTVTVNATTALSQPITLPPKVLVGFTGGNGGAFDRHAVSNVTVTVPAPPAAPAVVSTTPAGGASGVAIAAQVTATFNEAVTAPTSANFAVRDTLNNPLAGTVTYDATTNTATFVPSPVLAYSTTYTVTITGVTDLAGHPITAPSSWSFSTAPAPSACPCTALPSPVAGGWITNGTASITGGLLQLTPATVGAAGSAFWPTPVSSVYFTAAFDTTIDAGTGADGLTFTMADPTRGATPTSLGTNGGGLGFSGIPGLAVALDTFQNAANPSANFVGLTAGGQTPGSDLLLWMFTNSAVPPLRPGSNHVVVTVANGTLTAYINGNQVLSQPVTLPPQVLLGFTGGNGGAFDRHGVSNVAITIVAYGPAVASSTPAPGATNVALAAPITATFNKAVNAPTSTNFTLTNGASPVAGTVTYNPATTTATFTPGALLLYNTIYTATISGVTDSGGTTTMTAPFNWSFATVPAPPTVTDVTPAAGAANVAVTTTIAATFAHDITAPTTANFVVKDAANSPVAGTVTYSLNSLAATFTPAAPLANATTYTATISGVTDPTGTTAMTAPFVWSFTTGAAPPTVTATTPTSGATNVAVAATITATFSKPVTAPTTANFAVKDAANNPVAGTVSYDATTNTATFTPAAPLANATTYTVTVSAVTDPTGTTAMTAPFVWSFTTGAAPPTVTATTPTSGATNVAVAMITATFSEAVTAPTTANFAVKDAANNPVVGTVTYNSSTKTATFTPSSALLNNTIHTATVSGVTDSTGTAAMTAPFVWSFTTGACTTCIVLPSPIAGGWTTNGTTKVVGNLLQLTPATKSAAGSSFYSTAVSSTYFSVAFDATIDSGSGGDGMTFMMANPAAGAKPTSLGNNGGGLGFSGIPGLAFALDTVKNASNPSNNFVGLVAGLPKTRSLTWIATNTKIGKLRPTTNHFVVTVNVGILTATMNGTLVLSRAATLPSQVLLGFTGGNGASTDRHAVSNVVVTVVAPVPSVLSITPAAGARGVAVASVVTATFNEPVATPTAANFTVTDAANNTVAGTVTYNAATHVVTFTPTAPLAHLTTYTATVKGVTDTSGQAPMAAPSTWSFTTG